MMKKNVISSQRENVESRLETVPILPQWKLHILFMFLWRSKSEEGAIKIDIH